MASFDRQDIQQRLQQIEELVYTVEAASDSRLRDCALTLMRSLMEMHGTGLERMLEITCEAAQGEEIIQQFAEDEWVKHLLLLYDLHPEPLETRVLRALEQARPYLNSHSGNVELLSVTEGIVRLQLQGNCHSCPSSAATLQQTIEQAIYEAAPEVQSIEVEGLVTQAPSNGLVQLERAAVRG